MEFNTPADLLDYEDPEVSEQQALIEILRGRQQQATQERAAMQANLGRQQGQAGQLRSAALLSSVGQNPLLRGFQQEASRQGQGMDAMAARTEGRLMGGGGADPASALLRLRGLKQAEAKEKGIQSRFDASQAQRGQQFAEMMGFRWADLSASQKMKFAELADRKEGRADAKATKAEENLDNQTKDFGKEVAGGGFPEFDKQHSAAEQVLSKFKGDLPGVGLVDGSVPDRFTSDEGKQLRYALNQMKLAYQKSITGAGASDAERAAIAKATGLMDSNDPASIRLGVKMMKGVMDERKAALEAAYKPEAVQTYNTRRTGSGKQAVPQPQGAAPSPGPEPEQRKAVGGKTYVKRGGKWFQE